MLFQRLALHPPDRNEFSGLVDSLSGKSETRSFSRLADLVEGARIAKPQTGTYG